MMRRVPSSSSGRRVRSSTCATAAMEASASPRNPIVRRAKRSVACVILDVACRSKDSRASVSLIPFPSSITCTRLLPAFSTSTCICWAPASRAFSTSSFITEAGRCITSPAAIWLATESGSKCMMSDIYDMRRVGEGETAACQSFCSGACRRMVAFSSEPRRLGRQSKTSSGPVGRM